jgi:hypothetical protein
MTAADRQALYAAARARDMGEVAFALKTALARSRTERKAFVETYRGSRQELYVAVRHHRT